MLTNRALYEHLLRALRSALVEHATHTPGYIPHWLEIAVARPVFNSLREGCFHDPFAIADDHPPRGRTRTITVDRIRIVEHEDMVDFFRRHG